MTGAAILRCRLFVYAGVCLAAPSHQPTNLHRYASMCLAGGAAHTISTLGKHAQQRGEECMQRKAPCLSGGRPDHSFSSGTTLAPEAAISMQHWATRPWCSASLPVPPIPLPVPASASFHACTCMDVRVCRGLVACRHASGLAKCLARRCA